MNTITTVRFTNLVEVYGDGEGNVLDGIMYDIAEANEITLQDLEDKGVTVNAELITDEDYPDYHQQDPTHRSSLTDLVVPLTDDDPDAPDDGKVLIAGGMFDRTTGEEINDTPIDENDDLDAEEDILDEEPLEDAGSDDRLSHWDG